MDNNLFSLLRIGLGTEPPSEEVLRGVAEMTGKQWEDLRDIAERQGGLAIVLDGIDRLQLMGLSACGLPLEMKLEWIGEALQVEQANKHQCEVLEDLARKWAHAGCRVMVMKGQAHGMLYPKPHHRAAGDIDIYLFGNYAKGNDVAREAGAGVDESWYKHSVISYKGETFENHQFFVTTRSLKSGKCLEKELEEELNKYENNAGQGLFMPLTESSKIPPIQWTAMFMTYHSFSHFISEGLRLKQILDWAMFLKKHQNDMEWPRFYDFCDRHHLGRFADVSTAIAKEYLGVTLTNKLIRYESPYTNRVVHSIFSDDDYVFGSGKGNWYNRFHLVRNLWTYRWKYRDIYQMSPLRKLWYYATGFIFKTE